MKIAIEAQRIFRKNKHGMDFVALECIRHLQKIDLTNEYFILIGNGDDRCLEESPRMHILQLPCRGGYPMWEQWVLPRALQKIKPDLLHCTSNTAPLWGKTPLIVTLHDIIFLEKQSRSNSSLYQTLGRYYRQWVVPPILRRCRKIITVSEFECTRIRQALNLDLQKITYIHNGYSEYFHPVADSASVTSRYINTSSYLLFLGNTDPKKNCPGTIRAYSLYLGQSKIKRPLVVVDLSEKELDRILQEEQLEQIRPQIILPGYIPNQDLPALYSASFAFLYPSFRESFGIPILEAMSCGTPVITSDTSAIPEIAGDGGILIDPQHPEEIALALIHLESDSTYRDEMIRYGFEQSQKFSWNKTASQLLTLYQSVTNSDR